MVLSILVASWNTSALLNRLLTSLRDHAPSFDHEVIVVDNGSSDGTAAMVRSAFPGVRLIRNEANRGYAPANNQALKESRGDLVLLLGSDTELIDDSIGTMVGHLQRSRDIGAVCCRLLNPDRSPQASVRRFPTLWDGLMTYLSMHRLAPSYNMRGFDYRRTQDVEQPAATCLMLRRSLLDSIGLFDERFTILYNDVDLCRRIHAAGMRIVYAGDAEIVHGGSRTTRRATPEIRLEMYRNILLYYYLRYRLTAVIVLLLVLTLRLCIVNRGRSFLGLLSIRSLVKQT